MMKKMFVLIAMLFTGFVFAQNSLTGLCELEENKNSDQQMFVEFKNSGKMDVWVAVKTKSGVWEYEDKFTFGYSFDDSILKVNVGKKTYSVEVLFSTKRWLFNSDDMNKFLIPLNLEVYPSMGEYTAFISVKKAPQFKLVDHFSVEPDSGKNKELVVWSFTDELQAMIDNYYKKDHPEVKIDYSLTPFDEFSQKLDSTFASGKGVPDVMALEGAVVRKYVEQGEKYLLDLTDMYNELKFKMVQYPAEVGSYNGKVYALSWQTAPGAMFYRRSLAKKYLGTDDPDEVQKYFSDWNKFLSTARRLNNNSNGKCVVVSSTADIYKPFLGSRKDPWVVNGKLVIDPAMEEYMEMCKTLRDERLEGFAGQWAESWFAGMKGELRDDYGYRTEVFSYFFPGWGLHYVLKPNAPETYGDWGMIQGPSPYYWGGTWIAASKGTKKARLAKEFIKYICTDDSFQERWAKDTGDGISNNNVINKIKDIYSEPYIHGQNHYEMFGKIANEVNGNLAQGTDQVIEELWGNAVAEYMNGVKSKKQAIADFRSQVKSTLGL
ncbi:MAG: ABC transporter substrate-binding protein [Treponema sp.]|nr:ABC transporter substrate-binding protein [Treponema sp.]